MPMDELLCIDLVGDVIVLPCSEKLVNEAIEDKFVVLDVTDENLDAFAELKGEEYVLYPTSKIQRRQNAPWSFQFWTQIYLLMYLRIPALQFSTHHCVERSTGSI